jgi:hypothetical protein
MFTAFADAYRHDIDNFNHTLTDNLEVDLKPIQHDLVTCRRVRCLGSCTGAGVGVSLTLHG